MGEAMAIAMGKKVSQPESGGHTPSMKIKPTKETQ
jgi:hypothetical protein